MINDTDAYILAGGRSKRMQTDKALLEWENKYLIEHVYDLAKELFKSAFVVVKANSEIVSLNLPFVFDSDDDYCPIMGLYSALRHTLKPFIFVKACDNVLFEKDLVLKMLSLRYEADVIVPETSDGVHPLFSVYSKSCLVHVDDMIKRGNYKITDFFEKVKVYYMREKEIRLYDSNLVSMININTPADFEDFKKTYSLTGKLSRKH
jgi:molybdopterin-guanine dinucleotide biosynthesis protein A